jgi:ribosomal protein S18 acetylase RimI-like enzyme
VTSRLNTDASSRERDVRSCIALTYRDGGQVKAVNIRLAHPDEIEDVLTVVKAAIRHMESQGIHQWDEVYPDRFVLQADLDKGHMHIIEAKGRIAGVVVINEDQSPEYGAVPWQYQGRALVVRRLTIDPFHERRGLARQLMAFAEKTAITIGCDTVRLDAFTQNPGAVALYNSLGYRNAGTVQFRKGVFYCYEKQMNATFPAPQYGDMRKDSGLRPTQDNARAASPIYAIDSETEVAAIDREQPCRLYRHKHRRRRHAESIPRQ